MATDTIVREHAETEALLRNLPNGADIRFKRGEFSAMCHEPDDVIRGVFCCGRGPTLAEAIAKMREKMEAAKRANQKLRTAAECKDAVLNLIREHDAAPAAFRDAVDDLDVA